MERTYVMLKPDAVERNLMGDILSRIEKKGYRISAMKMEVLTEEQARKHYAEHVDKPFFPSLLEFITSGRVVEIVVEGENAVMGMRKMLGATDPNEAEPGSIRGTYGFSKTTNLVHASDSPSSAKREIALYFNENEIF
ncbi:nucleoside-diphosphate kinase [Clostridia bacterium]|nr:nucleoside-diphosphate kinase [Clostridia bacterium]